jgi:hypothetical protein
MKPIKVVCFLNWLFWFKGEPEKYEPQKGPKGAKKPQQK